MAPAKISAPIPIAARLNRFSYAIRNIVAEAHRVEASGRRVRYLNIGDPVAFGFSTPPHLIAAVERALHDGHNGYGPSPGIASGREAVAAEYTARGFPLTPDRAFLTAGTSEGIELVLGALVDEDTDVLVPMPTYPLYTAVIAKLGARALFYRTDPDRGWMPDLDHLRSLVTPATRALVVIDPNNPTGASYSIATRRALLDVADRHGLAIVADEVYGDLGYDGPVAPLGSLDPDAPIITFSSLSKAYLAPGWRAGWVGIGRIAALERRGEGGRQARGRPPVQHAADAIRHHRGPHRRPLASGRVPRRVEGACGADNRTIERDPWRDVRRADRRLLCHAAGSRCRRGAPTRTTCSRCCARPASCASTGQASAWRPADGYMRIVFLAAPDELRAIYDLMAEFTKDYLRR